MNQTQIKYARQRADAIKKQKLSEASARNSSKAISLSGSEKLEALRKGAFTLKAIPEGAHRADVYWYQYVDFGEKYAVLDRDAYNAEADKINKAFDSLMDELILGDDETAMRLMKEFEAL